MSDLIKLKVFLERMKKLGITLELTRNVPWIYIDKVNGNRIKQEDFFYGNHGFTIGFSPIKLNQEFEFTDINKIFKLIRKYK